MIQQIASIYFHFGLADIGLLQVQVILIGSFTSCDINVERQILNHHSKPYVGDITKTGQCKRSQERSISKYH